MFYSFSWSLRRGEEKNREYVQNEIDGNDDDDDDDGCGVDECGVRRETGDHVGVRKQFGERRTIFRTNRFDRDRAFDSREGMSNISFHKRFRVFGSVQYERGPKMLKR